MTSTTRFRNQEKQLPPSVDDGDQSNTKNSLLKALFLLYARRDYYTQYLLRIIGVIVVAGILVGLYELVGL